MNEEQKKSALRAKKVSDSFIQIMKQFGIKREEKFTVIMNLLCEYLLNNIKSEHFESVLKWTSKSIPVIVKNFNKTGFGCVSGDSDNIKIELIDKPNER